MLVVFERVSHDSSATSVTHVTTPTNIVEHGITTHSTWSNNIRTKYLWCSSDNHMTQVLRVSLVSLHQPISSNTVSLHTQHGRITFVRNTCGVRASNHMTQVLRVSLVSLHQPISSNTVSLHTQHGRITFVRNTCGVRASNHMTQVLRVSLVSLHQPISSNTVSLHTQHGRITFVRNTWLAPLAHRYMSKPQVLYGTEGWAMR